MKLVDALDEFYLDQAVKGNSNVTIKDYRLKLKFFLDFVGNINVEDIDLHLCRSYYLELKMTRENTTTIQTYIRSLRAFLNFLYNNEFIEIDLCRKFKLPKARQNHIDILTDLEIARIYDCFPGDDFYSLRNKVIVSLMLDSGLRRGEIIGALKAKLHLDERFIIVTGKGNKQRAVAFGLYTQSLLKKYLDICPSSERLIIKVSTLGTSEPIAVDTLKDLFRKLKIKANIPRLYAHLLRHTFATRYLENGGNIYSLQLLLGHTSLEMVKKYLHLAQNRVRKEFVNYSPVDRHLDALENTKKPPQN